MGEDTGTASTAHPPESGTADIPISQVKSTVDEEDYSSSISATDYALKLHGPTNTASTVMRSNSTSLSTLTDSTVSTFSLADWKPRGSRYENIPQLRQDGTSSHSDSDDYEVLGYAMSTSMEKRKVALKKRIRQKSRYPKGTQRTLTGSSIWFELDMLTQRI
jgi:hypothetical protein